MALGPGFAGPFTLIGSTSPRRCGRIKKNRSIAVMTYSHMTPALCGIIIKMLTGAKLVVEVATSAGPDVFA